MGCPVNPPTLPARAKIATLWRPRHRIGKLGEIDVVESEPQLPNVTIRASADCAKHHAATGDWYVVRGCGKRQHGCVDQREAFFPTPSRFPFIAAKIKSGSIAAA